MLKVWKFQNGDCEYDSLLLLQMLMDPMGGIVMTNDGNAILREVCTQIENLLC